MPWCGWRSDLGRWRGTGGEGDGSVDVEVTGVARGTGQRGTFIGDGACSQLVGQGGRRGVKNKREGKGDRGEREKKEVKTRSVYTKKCSASDSRTG